MNKKIKDIQIYIYIYIYIYKCIIIILINFVIATISFILNVAGDLPGIQAPPQPCSIQNKTDSDNIELDNNNNNSNNDNNNNIINNNNKNNFEEVKRCFK